MRPFQTESVVVFLPVIVKDELGEVTDSSWEEVDADVLVCSGSTSDLDATRPEGDRVVFTLHFPKAWTRALRGARVQVRDEMYKVSGDPQGYTVSNCPTNFNMPVEVVRVDG